MAATSNSTKSSATLLVWIATWSLEPGVEANSCQCRGNGNTSWLTDSTWMQLYLNGCFLKGKSWYAGLTWLLVQGIDDKTDSASIEFVGIPSLWELNQSREICGSKLATWSKLRNHFDKTWEQHLNPSPAEVDCTFTLLPEANLRFSNVIGLTDTKGFWGWGFHCFHGCPVFFQPYNVMAA